jgi:hypothetical protein
MTAAHVAADESAQTSAVKGPLTLDSRWTAFASSPDPWWTSGAIRALRTLAESGRPFQAFDLLALGVSEPDDPRRWGALVRAASTLGLIQVAGYAVSKRRPEAGGLVRVWRGTSG